MGVFGKLFSAKEGSPEEKLRRIITYIPENYKTHRQYPSAIEYLDNREFALAAESLVDLADESGHYFSQSFWKELSEVFNLFKLFTLETYCHKKIEETTTAVNYQIPFGWVTEKIGSNVYSEHIAEIIKEEWGDERYKKDGIDRILKQDGIYFKRSGTSGTLYIVKGDKLLEVYSELEMKKYALYFSSLKNWSYPVNRRISVEEKSTIKMEIKEWSEIKNIPFSFDDDEEK